MAHKGIFTVSPHKVLGWLLIAEFLLLMGNTAMQILAFVYDHRYVYGLSTLFTFGEEKNFQTFFSELLLLSSAALLFLISPLERQEGRGSIYWVVLGIGFLLMAFDEVFSFHELLDDALKEQLGDKPRGVFYFPWVIPALVVSSVLGVVFVRFLRQLPTQTARRFIVAALVYLAGAIGFELVGGRHAELYGRLDFLYSLYSTLEESLEMLGVTIFVWALLHYCVVTFGEVAFCFAIPTKRKS